ncbi:Rmf/CrpP fold protein [Streptomyces sp. NPDC021969]|uniref:Rmf/CrpP fold protein n=1 Tax=unclassified Streptomyces TaxID=2593676 RepID=UPI0033FDCC6A
MGPREQIVEAYLAGRKAGRKADPPRSCPYPADDLRRRAWFIAYGRARPVGDVDQGGE